MPGAIRTIAATLALVALAAPASAAVCDYKPSRLLSTMTSSAGGGSGVAGAVGDYALVNAKTGLSMLGTTALTGGPGAVVSGVSGFLSSAIAFVTAPATIVAGSVTAVALGGYEGACYFAVERVTDRDLVISILRSMEQGADPDRFLLVTPQNTDELTLVLRDPAKPEEVQTYEVRNLYIADGMLLHRDRLLNTRIGKVIFVDEAAGAGAPTN